MRDRLIELQCLAYDTFDGGKTSFEHTADVLLANGVVCLPCKVGDTVYFIIDNDESDEGKYISKQQINDVSTRGIFVSDSLSEENCNDFIPYSDFGKSVFLSEEEAEQALEEGTDNA